MPRGYLTEVVVPGDGDCFFHSIARELPAGNVMRNDEVALRVACAERICQTLYGMNLTALRAGLPVVPPRRAAAAAADLEQAIISDADHGGDLALVDWLLAFSHPVPWFHGAAAVAAPAAEVNGRAEIAARGLIRIWGDASVAYRTVLDVLAPIDVQLYRREDLLRTFDVQGAANEVRIVYVGRHFNIARFNAGDAPAPPPRAEYKPVTYDDAISSGVSLAPESDDPFDLHLCHVCQLSVAVWSCVCAACEQRVRAKGSKSRVAEVSDAAEKASDESSALSSKCPYAKKSEEPASKAETRPSVIFVPYGTEFGGVAPDFDVRRFNGALVRADASAEQALAEVARLRALPAPPDGTHEKFTGVAQPIVHLYPVKDGPKYAAKMGEICGKDRVVVIAPAGAGEGGSVAIIAAIALRVFGIAHLVISHDRQVASFAAFMLRAGGLEASREALAASPYVPEATRKALVADLVRYIKARSKEKDPDALVPAGKLTECGERLIHMRDPFDALHLLRVYATLNAGGGVRTLSTWEIRDAALPKAKQTDSEVNARFWDADGWGLYLSLVSNASSEKWATVPYRCLPERVRQLALAAVSAPGIVDSIDDAYARTSTSSKAPEHAGSMRSWHNDDLGQLPRKADAKLEWELYDLARTLAAERGWGAPGAPSGRAPSSFVALSKSTKLTAAQRRRAAHHYRVLQWKGLPAKQSGKVVAPQVHKGYVEITCNGQPNEVGARNGGASWLGFPRPDGAGDRIALDYVENRAFLTAFHYNAGEVLGRRVPAFIEVIFPKARPRPVRPEWIVLRDETGRRLRSRDILNHVATNAPSQKPPKEVLDRELVHTYTTERANLSDLEELLYATATRTMHGVFAPIQQKLPKQVTMPMTGGASAAAFSFVESFVTQGRAAQGLRAAQAAFDTEVKKKTSAKSIPVHRISSWQTWLEAVAEVGISPEAYTIPRLLLFGPPAAAPQACSAFVLTPGDAYTLPLRILGSTVNLEKFRPEYSKMKAAAPDVAADMFQALFQGSVGGVAPAADCVDEASAMSFVVATHFCECIRNWRQLPLLAAIGGHGRETRSSKQLLDAGELPVADGGWKNHGTWGPDRTPVAKDSAANEDKSTGNSKHLYPEGWASSDVVRRGARLVLRIAELHGWADGLVAEYLDLSLDEEALVARWEARLTESYQLGRRGLLTVLEPAVIRAEDAAAAAAKAAADAKAAKAAADKAAADKAAADKAAADKAAADKAAADKAAADKAAADKAAADRAKDGSGGDSQSAAPRN